MAYAAVQHDFVLRLRDDLAQRRIESGIQALQNHLHLVAAIGPDDAQAPVLVGYVAQWVDAGFATPGLVEKLVARFVPESRIHLPLIGYLHLRVAEGLVAMAAENYARAIDHLALVESVEEELKDNELIAIANFWIGRCLRSQGRYDDALQCIIKARDLASAIGCDRLAAVMRITESWLLFQKGRITDAAAILDECEAVLHDTEDYVALGNIQSAHGRMARWQGRYDRAIEHFTSAIEWYRRRDVHHPNLARSLTNIAYVRRIVSLQLEKSIDEETARRKGGKATPNLPAIASERSRLQRMRTEALDELNEADSIYARTDNHRGRGGVLINRGLLHVDSRLLDDASAEASEAYLLAEDKQDNILMARARVLQCVIENTKLDEQIDEGCDPHLHGQRAQEFAREAVELAGRTQNRRLLARAYIWQGLTFTNGFSNNPEAGRRCCDAATELLRPEGREYLWDDLQELKARILKKVEVDTVLREWSEGLVREKTFQQISEEFATIVIPRVWEREGRRISRVAEKLSISPKKIRRLLQAAGVTASAEHGGDARNGNSHDRVTV